MSERVLFSGNHAIAEAAILSGCTAYFGYPITPQNALPEYMAANLRRRNNGVFIQAESELAAINMVIGASAAGARVMTSSSSPGISLKQEGISFLAGMELPAVIVNMNRGGPGLGNIAPAQSDYFQSTRGGGHGDYRVIVLAPGSVQELIDATRRAFELADRYRTPVLILGDGMIGQLMEPVVLPEPIDPAQIPERSYTLSGASGRPKRLIKSLILDTAKMEEHNWKLFRKYEMISAEIADAETEFVEGAKLLVVAFGTAARIAKGAVKRARAEGMDVGLIRPLTLWPFPKKALAKASRSCSNFCVFEMNTGQMVEDVRLSVQEGTNVVFSGRPGGVVPTPIELYRAIARIHHRVKKGAAV
ncbi:MAG: 3-methyl-2-oxobutanoate dehydrogenase subunit VorB [Candidatus Alcyoniella australis]|nr:3-methyl-2-oxobutanoate dehydrogenase subunit VorB [Candidatus Alcyoniella australis]